MFLAYAVSTVHFVKTQKKEITEIYYNVLLPFHQSDLKLHKDHIKAAHHWDAVKHNHPSPNPLRENQ
jgi:hypothetical protein